jgi:L-alanine-DL-glutamate epimerase-like enolase superfamily enzyme
MSGVVTDVVTVSCRVPLRLPFVTALRRTEAVDAVLVEVHTDDGYVGLGEATPIGAITGESVASVQAALGGPLREAVVGRDADDLVGALGALQRALPANPSAKAGLDIALHDLTSQRLGIPLQQYLGTTCSSVATDVGVSAASPKEMAAEAVARVGGGFGILKLKLGDGRHDDIRRVLSVREAVGPSVGLRLDANQGWGARQAVRILAELERQQANVEFVEQPVPALDLGALAFVTGSTATPVLADEAVWSARDVLVLAERKAADLVNLKLMKCGGLGPARAAAAVAEATGMGWLVGGMMETAVAVTAGAAFAATGAANVVHDLDAAWWLAPPNQALRYEGGRLFMPNAPGLRSVAGELGR